MPASCWASVTSLSITQPPDFRLSKQQWGFFLQDTWKVTRKLTLDYGLRYDYSTYLKEQYGRLLNFSPSVPNPTAGGILGAVIFEGNGPGHCGCDFANNYPLALAPRLGAAYQINSKTVFRAGFGIVYTRHRRRQRNYGRVLGQQYLHQPPVRPAFHAVAERRSRVPPSQYSWPNFDPGQFPKGTSLTSPNVFYDQNAGRPARQYQWSAGIQREIFKDLAVEASYVGESRDLVEFARPHQHQCGYAADPGDVWAQPQQRRGPDHPESAAQHGGCGQIPKSGSLRGFPDDCLGGAISAAVSTIRNAHHLVVASG